MDKTDMYMSADEVAEYLGCKKHYAYEIIKKVNKKMQDEYPSTIISKGKVNRKYFLMCLDPLAVGKEG